MVVWYNPADMQVMALYDTVSSSQVWSDAGYLKATISDENIEKLLLQHGRDATITVRDNIVTSVTGKTNPIQPTLSADEIEHQNLLVKVKDNTATLNDVLRVMQIERKL